MPILRRKVDASCIARVYVRHADILASAAYESDTGSLVQRLEATRRSVEDALRRQDLDQRSADAEELEARAAAPGFWDQPSNAEETLRELGKTNARNAPQAIWNQARPSASQLGKRYPESP